MHHFVTIDLWRWYTFDGSYPEIIWKCIMNFNTSPSIILNTIDHIWQDIDLMSLSRCVLSDRVTQLKLIRPICSIVRSRYPRHLDENLNYGESEIGRAFSPLHFARSSVRTETVPHSRPFLCLLRRSYSPPGPLIVLIQT